MLLTFISNYYLYMNLFDILKDIITIKSGTLYKHPEFKKAFSTFMIVRYLSMDKRFMDIAFDANKLQTILTQEQMYIWLIKVVPYYKNSFIKYISKPKKKDQSTQS